MLYKELVRKSNGTGKLDRATLVQFKQALFLGHRVGSRKAAPFWYIKATDDVEKHSKFGDTHGTLYRKDSTGNGETK